MDLWQLQTACLSQLIRCCKSYHVNLDCLTKVNSAVKYETASIYKTCRFLQKRCFFMISEDKLSCQAHNPDKYVAREHQDYSFTLNTMQWSLLLQILMHTMLLPSTLLLAGSKEIHMEHVNASEFHASLNKRVMHMHNKIHRHLPSRASYFFARRVVILAPKVDISTGKWSLRITAGNYVI